jgi:cardiolipin-specific phospholipase
MTFWMSAAAIAGKLDRLRAAETRLLELAHRFGRNRAKIEVVDTFIPRNLIPLVSHDHDLVKLGNDDESFVIHSVKVSSEDKAEEANAPLVLLHGYMNGAAYFYRNLVGLSSAFNTVHSIDLLGWGLSSRPRFELKRIEEEANDKSDNFMVRQAEHFFVESLEAWRHSQGIPKMILAGHSMGGYISVAYAERYPERVEKLVLISPAGVPAQESPDRQKRLDEARKRSLFFRFVFGTWSTLYSWNSTIGSLLRMLPEERAYGSALGYVQRRLPAISDEEEQKAVTDYLVLNNLLPGSGEYCVGAFLTQFLQGREPTELRIPKLKVPSVSFLYGAQDWMDIHGALRVEAHCGDEKDVAVYRVSNAGHLLMLENWQEFNNGLIHATGRKVDGIGSLPERVTPADAHFRDAARIMSAWRNGVSEISSESLEAS